jgi:hypothetical protein
MDDGCFTDANWGPQDASHPKEGATVMAEEVKSLLGHVIFWMGGPVCWGCTRKKDTISRSSCKSKIYSANEGTKSILTICHLLQDLGQPDGHRPTPLWNDNCGCANWTKGCTVSRKLLHINMHELAVSSTQQNKDISIEHITGKFNIADIFTKEMKDTNHYNSLALAITSPHRILEILQLPQKLTYTALLCPAPLVLPSTMDVTCAHLLLYQLLSRVRGVLAPVAPLRYNTN